MTNASFVSLFYGCHYDPVKGRIHWDSDGEMFHVLLDAEGKASSAHVSYECDDGSWTDWAILPQAVCDNINEGLGKAKELGIALSDIGRAILDSDLETVLLA